MNFIENQCQKQQGNAIHQHTNSWEISTKNAIFWRKLKLQKMALDSKKTKTIKDQITYLEKQLDLIIAFNVH